ncbi:DUF4129 domain-containing protein [Gordonia insulae]|uniref:Protein-glutamine gamma-glutamyltransferase-like C-terminal domain-containing protein n=1 Tax=Gordonia insulae TaxID=2420509 RepID=A0A3G8JPS8_9ACTN|nr:DUF4129 domain-containing protein [Gordonia insulae]AZG46978.1 hypothetical protein D7316_03583 [Gordonia insulae]
MTAVVLAAGLTPSNDEARDWLERELAKPRYGTSEPGLLERIGRAIEDWLDSVLSSITGTSTPLPGFVAAIVAIALLALGLYLLRFVRRTPRAAKQSTASVLGGHDLTADEFRRRAQVACTDGQFDVAVLDGMRAIARRALERTLLPDAPSLTAHEVAIGLAGFFPASAHRLSVAAAVFDEVAYGGRRATSAQAQEILDLDGELSSTRPRSATHESVEVTR